METKKLNIVLFQPEIPENTGNISRNCVGFNANLHLIRPYGFIVDQKRVKRAGLDYWEHLNMFQYDDWNDFITKNNIQDDSKNIFLITKFADKKLSLLSENDFEDNKNIFFVFGRETKGLPEEITNRYFNQRIGIEMNDNVRSFNLANCAAIISYNFHYLTKFKYL